MSFKSFFLSLFQKIDDDELPQQKGNHSEKIAAMDSLIQRNLEAIKAKADESPEALEAATLCLDSITVNLRNETDKLKDPEKPKKERV